MIKSFNIQLRMIFLKTRNKQVTTINKNKFLYLYSNSLIIKNKIILCSLQNNFNNFSKYNFSKYDSISNQDIKKKLKDKWEKKHGLIGGMPNLFSNKNLNTVKFL